MAKRKQAAIGSSVSQMIVPMPFKKVGFVE
jgi:hypothetical protein